MALTALVKDDNGSTDGMRSYSQTNSALKDSEIIQSVGTKSFSTNAQNNAQFEPTNVTEVRSFKNLSELKTLTSLLAMHLSRETRSIIFSEIDYLLDPNDFDISEDSLISPESFQSYLRFLTYYPSVCPGNLGVAFSGDLFAVWLEEDGDNEKLLNIEFLPEDHVKCSFSNKKETKLEEAFSYVGPMKRLEKTLAPYSLMDFRPYVI